MIVTIVVAISENNAIGKDNELLWYLPKELRHFKTITNGHTVIMGRKTFESFGKPLPGRTNIVITNQENWTQPGTIVVKDLDEALQAAEGTDAKEAFVIGGGQIFRQSISRANRIYLTRVHTKLEGDVFLPDINENDWELVSSLDFNADEKHAYAYSFQVWERKSG